MKPRALLDDSKVVLDIDKSTPKADIIRLLAMRALGGESPIAAQIVQDLQAREEKMSTGIGQGVAIPHTRTATIDYPVAAMGLSREGVDFEAVDEEPVHIVFAFITPESDPALHIQTLGAVASLFADEAVRNALTNASSVAEALKAVEVEA